MIPRTDRLRPPDEGGIPQRAVTLEKLVDELQDTIDASIPTPTLPEHTAYAHDFIYGVIGTSGLNVTLSSGRVQFDNATYSHGVQGLALTASATNYIVANSGGTITASVIPPVSGQIPLWQITTDTTNITSITDLRSFIARGGGGGGGGTLDTAYDFGGPGAGRTIDANDGPVLVRNTQADVEPNLELQRASADVNNKSALRLTVSGEALPRVDVMADKVTLSSGAVSSDNVYITREGAGLIGFHNHGAGSTGAALEFLTVTAPATPGSNITRLYQRTFGGGPGHFFKTQTGAELGPLGEKSQATVSGRGTAGGWEPPLSATWSDSLWGTCAPTASWTVTGTPSMNVDTAANRRGRYGNFQTGAVSGNDAGIETPAGFYAGAGASYLIRFALPVTSSIRCFVGIAAQTLATMVGSDATGTNHLGLQFSTPRADTNWQFTERGTGAQVLTNTGVAPVASTPVSIQIITGVFTQMALLDDSFIPVATRSVGVLSKPGGTTAVSIIIGIETQTSASRDLRLYQLSQHNRDS